MLFEITATDLAAGQFLQMRLHGDENTLKNTYIQIHYISILIKCQDYLKKL